MSAEIDVEFEFQMNSQNYVVTINPDTALSDMKEYFIDQTNLPSTISMGFVYKDTLYTRMNETIGKIVQKGDHPKFRVLIEHEITIFNQKAMESNSREATTPEMEPKIKINTANYPKITCTNYTNRQAFSIRFEQGMTYGQLNDAIARSTQTSIQFVKANGNPVNINYSAVLQNQDPIFFIERLPTGQQQPPQQGQPEPQQQQNIIGGNMRIIFIVSDFRTIQRELEIPSSETLEIAKQILFKEFQLNSEATTLDFFYLDGIKIVPEDMKKPVQKLAQIKNIQKINVKITYPGGAN